MKRVKVIDLFNVRFNEMEDKINQILEEVETKGKIIDVKPIGDNLNKCAIFVVYEN